MFTTRYSLSRSSGTGDGGRAAHAVVAAGGLGLHGEHRATARAALRLRTAPGCRSPRAQHRTPRELSRCTVLCEY